MQDISRLAGGRPRSDEGWTSVMVTTHDGLRLHVRDYAGRAISGPPLVCLPGLARNGGEFHELALRLANDPSGPTRILALDYRGRGRSDYDPNHENYTLVAEIHDLMTVLTAFELPPAVFLGTSRGGLLTMTLAPLRPGAIVGAILNDIGPVIEPQGLMRIKGYVGKLPEPRSLEDGAEILRRLGADQFPKLDSAGWLRAARLTWRDVGDRLVLDYDPKLSRTLAAIDMERPLPALWPQFDALARIPLMVIRGMTSDILSSATVEAMRARRPDLEVLEMTDQGHAPMLLEPETMDRIAAFVKRCATTM